MKQIKQIIVLLLVNFAFAQNVAKVEYTLYNNTEVPNVVKTILTCDNNNALFGIFYGNNKETKEIDENTNSIRIKEISFDEYQKTDVNKKNLQSVNNIEKDFYLIKEDLTVFNWVIDSVEVRQIDKYICNKATTSFRGRNYVAWFSTEIPFSFGPWKFSGLPGLILEVYDETDRFHWIVKCIDISTKKDVNFEIPNSKILEEITLKEFVTKKQQIEIDRNKRISAILPRGSKMISSENGLKGSLEIKYEWELEKEIVKE